MNDNIRCTAPGCKKCLPPEAMWLPERRALAAANGGRRVESSDFPKFALCGRHGHLLREEGVRVYRFADEVKRDREAEGRRQADALSFKPFAQRFVVQTKPQANGSGQPRRPAGDGRNVGSGLSRLAKMDAAKRPSPAKTEEPAPSPAAEAEGDGKPNGATVAPPA